MGAAAPRKGNSVAVGGLIVGMYLLMFACVFIYVCVANNVGWVRMELEMVVAFSHSHEDGNGVRRSRNRRESINSQQTSNTSPI